MDPCSPDSAKDFNTPRGDSHNTTREHSNNNTNRSTFNVTEGDNCPDTQVKHGVDEGMMGDNGTGGETIFTMKIDREQSQSLSS